MSTPQRRQRLARAIPTIALGLLLLPGRGAAQQGAGPESGHGSGPTAPGPRQSTPSGGAELYAKYCAQCHGEKGDGHGIAAPLLRPAPRDFTAGKFHVRSTPTGSLPTDDDLRRVIRKGLPNTAMPAFGDALKDAEIDQLLLQVKSFSPRFQTQKPGEIVPVPKDPGYAADQVAAARKVYTSIGCARCHGEEGRGDGPSAPSLKDDWGQPMRPADLSRPWTFNSGATREDIFRAISTGLNGTPMAGFASALSEQQRWSLVDFITALAGGKDHLGEPHWSSLLVARKVEGALDMARGKALFEGAPTALLPTLGQVIQPGRDFAPAVIAVEAQAVYNATEVAVRVRWHDTHADTSGNNGPDFELPPKEEHPGPEAASAAAPSGNPFAGEEGAPGAAAAKPSDPFAADEAAPAAKPASSGAPGTTQDVFGEAAPAAGAAGASEFSDAVALQFPRQLPEGVRRPYFIFGDAQDPVELWFVDLAHANKAELWEGKGIKELGPGEGVTPQVMGSYDRGEWSVTFLRKRDAGRGISFPDDTFVPIAFSVWDGSNRERGNKRALTTWYNLYVPPAVKPSPWVPMAKAAGGVLLVELLVIGLARRRARRTRAQLAAGGVP